MKSTTAEIELPANIYRAGAGYEGKVKVGTGASALRESQYWTVRDDAAMLRWVSEARARLQKERAKDPTPTAGTFAAGVQRYLALANLTPATLKVRTSQLAYWCAQPAALAAPVVTPAQYQAAPDERRGRTLGDVPLVRVGKSVSLPPAVLDRIRKVLEGAFAPTDRDADPTEYGNTSNHYRQALYQVFRILNRNDPFAPRNPIALIETRARAGAKLSGLDLRIVREILGHVASRFGHHDGLGERRLAVLAWVNITPKQLAQLDPAKAFHDDPDATREAIAAGAVTLTKPPRHKGRAKVVPPPETIPLTPYGVEALRAYAANPPERAAFSVSSLNKQFKRAAGQAQASLAAAGVEVDLSAATVYHLKHSLASAMMQATNGLFDRRGELVIAPAVVKANDHRSARTTKIYTASAVAPILREANEAFTAWLDRRLAEPLTPPPSLRIVGRKAAK
jgi:hypothetical protein